MIGDVTPASDDPLFHPFLYGSRLGSDYRGGFYGIAGWHKEGHLLRALFEGVMFEHRRHIEVLAKAGVSFDRAVLSGGGSRSPHWPQMFADGLGVPITVPEARETGALGAAIGAGVAAGIFSDYEAGIAAMTRPRSICHPDAAMTAHYDRRYRLFGEISKAMRPLWNDLLSGPKPA